jgi:hypothetical protein
MVAENMGIRMIQNKFRQRLVRTKTLDMRVHRSNEICVSILNNVDSNFHYKKISTTSYHLYTSKLIKIQKELSESIVGRLTRKYLNITRVELKITELLTYITCSDLRILLNWIMNTGGVGLTDSPKTVSFTEKFDFIESVFIPIRYEKSIDDIITVECPEDQIMIDASEEQTRIIIYDFIDDIQYNIYGNFKKDSINLRKLYTFYNEKYDLIIENISGLHIPPEFKNGYLEQMRIDDIVGKEITVIMSTISMAYSNAKEYKCMPLNILVAHFMNGNIESKAYMLTLLLLFETNTRYVATVLFDFLMNSENSSATVHEIYCNMHWTIQKNFEYSYKNTIEKIKSMEVSTDKIPYDKRLLISSAPEEAKAKAVDKLKSVNSSEGGGKAQQWLDGFLKIPFGKYKTHSVIDELDVFKYKLSILKNRMSLVKRYEDLCFDVTYTSHNVSTFVSKIMEINKDVKLEALDITILEYVLDNQSNSDSDDSSLNDSNSSDSSINKLTSIKDINPCSSSTSPFGRRKQITDDSDSSFDEKITLINGTLQRRRSYRPVSTGVFDENKSDSNLEKPNTSFFSEKSLFIELKELCNEWKIYENQKRVYIASVKEKLDDACFGHNDAKLEIQRLVGQWINGSTDGTVIGIQGPPGNGKTTLAKMGMSKCLLDTDGKSRPFAMLTLGGSSNASTLVGHNFTYVGSTWGRIVDILIEKNCMNPIIYIDEVDKISRTEHGREITGILTHLTDSTQNDHFEDRYFSGIPFDLSKAIIIMSFNDPSLIDPILRDRMHMIETNPLSTSDKLHIIDSYVMPSILETVGFSKDDIIIDNETSTFLIESFTYEAGVRKLKELLYEIIREINLRTIIGSEKQELPFKISKNVVNDILRKKHKIRIKSIHSEPKIGLINGLYATTAGIGGLTTIEVFRAYSKTFLELILTGSQGDVMKESIKCAKTIAWNLIPHDFKEQFNNSSEKEKEDTSNVFALHVHTPECGTPKDGPSAGAAITLAILSQLTSIPIQNNVAMTGEIDLNGNVTAIGGLQSKIQGALRAGIKKVLIPFDNKQDLDDIIRDERIIEITDTNVDFTVITVENIHDMLPHVLVENNIKFINYT